MCIVCIELEKWVDKELYTQVRLENVYYVIVTDLRNVGFQKSVFVCAFFEVSV